MDQGKVAVVAYENVATQEWFERMLEQQAPTYLGCEIIQMHAGKNEQVLHTLNTLLTSISLEQATNSRGMAHGNYLLWVTENEDFTPEIFQLLRKIVFQFSGLQIKLYVSVTSDQWRERLFDIAGRKVAYWFIPANTPLPDLAAPETAANLATKPTATVRRPNLWVPAVGVLVLLAAAAFWLRDSAEFSSPAKPLSANTQDKNSPLADDDKAEATNPSGTKPNNAPTTKTEGSAGNDQRTPPSAQASVDSTTKNTAPSDAKAIVAESTPSSARNTALASLSASSPTTVLSPAASAAAPVSSEPPTSQTLTINTQADCPTSSENLPIAKPTRYIKDTNYIYIKSQQTLNICIASDGNAYRLVNLIKGKGTRIYGKSPWQVYSPDLNRVELYFQGARVMLAPSVTDHVQVVPL